MTFSGIDHNLHSTVKLKMSKDSVKTILITLYLSAVQDPEPLYNIIFEHGFDPPRLKNVKKNCTFLTGRLP